MITLYQWEMSPFCDKVRRVLHVKRQPYRVEELDLAAVVTGKLRKINPVGKVPALEHDGKMIVDSSEIVRHLEREFPEPSLIPSEPGLRGLVHVLEDWADESLYFYELHLRLTMRHNAQKWVPELTKRDAGVVRALARFVVPRETRARTRAQGVGKKSPDAIHADIERHVGSLGDLLGKRQWLVGDALTLADIAVFVQLFCIRSTLEGWPIINGTPNVVSWMDRVDAATRAA